MATVIIPVRPDIIAQTIDVVLDGSTYRVRVAWNERTAVWSFDVMDTANTLIAVGAAIVPDWNPLKDIVRAGLPPGRFVVFDTSGLGTPPTRSEFGQGKRVELLYQTASELVA